MRTTSNKTDMDQATFETHATAARRSALSASRAMGVDPHSAEDIAQETLIRLWSMREDLERFKSMVALAGVVAHRLCIDRFRRRTEEGEALTGEFPSTLIAADARLEEEDNERWLAQKLKTLPSTEYQVLHLRQVEGRSKEEIARLLGIEARSVATLLARARQRLLNEIRKRNAAEK